MGDAGCATAAGAEIQAFRVDVRYRVGALFFLSTSID
jgi:hypothetical protein